MAESRQRVAGRIGDGQFDRTPVRGRDRTGQPHLLGGERPLDPDGLAVTSGGRIGPVLDGQIVEGLLRERQRCARPRGLHAQPYDVVVVRQAADGKTQPQVDLRGHVVDVPAVRVGAVVEAVVVADEAAFDAANAHAGQLLRPGSERVGARPGGATEGGIARAAQDQIAAQRGAVHLTDEVQDGLIAVVRSQQIQGGRRGEQFVRGGRKQPLLGVLRHQHLVAFHVGDVQAPESLFGGQVGANVFQAGFEGGRRVQAGRAQGHQQGDVQQVNKTHDRRTVDKYIAGWNLNGRLQVRRAANRKKAGWLVHAPLPEPAHARPLRAAGPWFSRAGTITCC